MSGEDNPQCSIRRYSHFVFAVIQSGLTCLLAAGIASLPVVTVGHFLTHWTLSWIISWMMMRRSSFWQLLQFALFRVC